MTWRVIRRFHWALPSSGYYRWLSDHICLVRIPSIIVLCHLWKSILVFVIQDKYIYIYICTYVWCLRRLNTPETHKFKREESLGLLDFESNSQFNLAQLKRRWLSDHAVQVPIPSILYFIRGRSVCYFYSTYSISKAIHLILGEVLMGMNRLTAVFDKIS